MGRIRTIKPEFFRHEGLQEIQNTTTEPIMLFFAGLWTIADREGRFLWKPRQLKLDILPFLDYSPDGCLAMLADLGVVRKYELNGQFYGDIPSFGEHQLINPREAQSRLPACPSRQLHAITGKPQEDTGNSSGKGKGREKEGEGEQEDACAHPVNEPTIPELVLQIVCAHPKNVERHMNLIEAPLSHQQAVYEAMGDEMAAAKCRDVQALELILSRTSMLAEKVPRSEWRYFKEVGEFFRLHEYRKEPEDFTRGGINGKPNRAEANRTSVVDAATEVARRIVARHGSPESAGADLVGADGGRPAGVINGGTLRLASAGGAIRH